MINDTLTHLQIINGVNSLFYFGISAGAEATGERVTAQEKEANPWGLWDGSVAGLRLDAFPDEETWQDMLTFFRQHQPLCQEVGVHTDGLLSLPTLFMVIVIIAIFKDIFCPPMTRSETEFFVLFLSVLSKQEIWTAMPRTHLARRPRGGTRGYQQPDCRRTPPTAWWEDGSPLRHNQPRQL